MCLWSNLWEAPRIHCLKHLSIEVDLEKVKAIIDMSPPKNISQLKTLQGQLQSIQRFIAQLVDKCHPYIHLLHKNILFQ